MPPTMPTRLTINGRDWWRFLDGTVLPVVSGGAEDDAGSDDAGGTDDDGGDSGDQGSGDLGDAGKKALEAERTRAKAAEKAHKAAMKELADARKRLADIDASSKSDTEKAIEKAKAEAAESATKEAVSKANARVLKAEIRAAAAGKLADPADALRLLDLDDFDVDEDGEVDAKAIAKALDELVKSKPYLAAKGGRPAGNVDQGVRGSTNNQPMSPQERMRRAYSSTK